MCYSYIYEVQDDISNLPLEIKILLLTESRLKIEQTVWHDVKKIEFWAFNFLYNVYTLLIFLSILYNGFRFDRKRQHRGTTIIGENHKSTYSIHEELTEYAILSVLSWEGRSENGPGGGG